jgi:SAM-dependent methyltransferase
MSNNLIYRYPTLYKILITFLYRNKYRTRFQAIADKVPEGSSVLDVCCGDCSLYTVALKGKCKYVGLDLSSEFVSAASDRGIRVLRRDVTIGPLPESDIVVIQGSLYQFFPDHGKVLDRLIVCAKQAVIISEPIRNMSDSSNRFVSQLARTLVPSNNMHFRFSRESFFEFIEQQYSELVETIAIIDGGRDAIVVLRTG